MSPILLRFIILISSFLILADYVPNKTVFFLSDERKLISGATVFHQLKRREELVQYYSFRRNDISLVTWIIQIALKLNVDVLNIQ